MGGASIWHWVVVGGIVMLLFGRGKISEMMGDVAKGIKAFKKGMTDEEVAAASTTTTTTVVPGSTTEPVRTLEHAPAHPASATTSTLADRKLG
jgi:sec-independent protein translocase protein TatA